MSLKDSNLYAEKVYSDYPLSLWTFDDDISYLQIFSDSQRDLSDTSLWNLENIKHEVPIKYEKTPIKNSDQYRFSSLFAKSNIIAVAAGTNIGPEPDYQKTDMFLTFGKENSQFSKSIGAETGGSLVSVIYDGEKFLALKSLSGDIYYSYNGSDWQLSDNGLNENRPWWNLLYNDGLYIASGGGAIRVSEDGIDWSSSSAYYLGHYYYESIVYGNNRYVGTGQHRFGGQSNAIVSTDGTTWVEYPLPTSTVDKVQMVGYGAENFVILLEQTNEGFFSSDGISWNSCIIQSGALVPSLGKLIYGNGVFICIGSQQEYLISFDNGITWTAKDFGQPAGFIRTISFSSIENKFYGISSYDRKIYSSFDGISWESEPLQNTDFAEDFFYTTLSIKELTSLNDISKTYTSEISSNFTLNTSEYFTDNKSTACFSAHIYPTSIFISHYDIGIRYGSEEEYSRFYFGSNIGWNKIYHTFNIPENENVSFFIRVKFDDTFLAENSDYEFQVNGLSLGQWGEQFNDDSLGVNDISLPSDLSSIISSSASYTCIIADSYGLNDDNNGYYLINQKDICTRNSGIPLVFGSKNSTKVFDAGNGNPSILLPGQGFLNNSGKYNSYTLEAWVRIKNESSSAVKIIGPVFSDDGIYVEDGYIYIVIGGKYSKYYYVGKWYRPMLLHLKYSPDAVYLYINGSEVLYQSIDVNSISLANKYNGDIDQDWIGIYGNDLVNPFEIDCISIFPYNLPIEVAKKRFVYGQGVSDSEPITPYYNSQKVFFDYSNSEYAANMIYPDIVSWDQPFSINIKANSSYISVPDYELPEFSVNDDSISYSDWIEGNRQDISSSTDTFDYFRIMTDNIKAIQNTQASFNFDSINILNENLRSIVGVFNADISSDSDQPLMVFTNNATSESIKIVLKNHDTDENLFILKYIYKDYNSLETLIKQSNINKSDYFVAGIDISQLQQSYSQIIGSFLSSKDNISLTIGKDGSNVFYGKIYSVHFIDDFFFNKDNSQYFTSGIANQVYGIENSYEHFISYTANYSIIPLFNNSIFSLDIGCKSYWEDSLPLSYFAKYVIDSEGSDAYDLDIIQFNIDATKTNDTYTNSFITFKDSSSIGSKTYSDYENVEGISSNKVVEFNIENYSNTKYRVEDSSIIIPPKDNFSSYYLGVHLEFEVRGVLNKTFLIKRMEISSNSFNDTAPTKIGTRYSEPVYPFVRDGLMFKYKETNPLTIYKGSSQYLYLTDDSGMYVNNYTSTFQRGFFIPVNKNKEDDFNLGAFEFWSWYPDELFMTSENKKISSIIYEDNQLDIYLYPEPDGKRAVLKTINKKTGVEEKSIKYVQDGDDVENPIIYPRRWTAINIAFLNPIKFSYYTGKIEFYSGILFNNIVKYKYSTDIANSYRILFIKWFQVTTDIETNSTNSWSEWSKIDGTNEYGTWAEQSGTVEPSNYSINAKNIYNGQVGISTVVADDNSRINIYSNGANIFTDITWKNIEKVVS